MRLDPKKTVLLTLDCQMGIFGFVPGAEATIPVAARAVEFARARSFQIIHVGLGFAAGHPEISEVDSPFKMVKQNNLFVKDTLPAAIHWSYTNSGFAHSRRMSCT